MKLFYKTTRELLTRMQIIQDDPSNKELVGGLYVYTAKARKQLDQLTKAVEANRARATLTHQHREKFFHKY
jgi:hypothetical protein